jgi:hypothetical protein
MLQMVGTVSPWGRSSWLTIMWGASCRKYRLDNVLNGRISLTISPFTKATGPNGTP